MTPERFAEVERVCQAALDEPPEGRQAFVAKACEGDPELRAEVESLLGGAAPSARLLGGRAFATIPPLAAGTRLGPYEVEAAIGAGGMGEVYRARDTRLGRVVAIKILPPALRTDPERRARFDREARIISALTHPHICTLYDVGEADGQLFLVMEHLAGETLTARLSRGPMAVAQVLEIGAQIAEALDAAHKQGIVHRDLKPANVMLTKGGVKLLDFGLAKLKGHGERPAAATTTAAGALGTLTGEGSILGTLPYMAPEQIEGKPADARTDLWAFGAMLYEMLAGQRAFDGASSAVLLANIINAEPMALATRQPTVPPTLERLVRNCLAKDPDDRWDSAHALASELRWLRDSSDAREPLRAPSRRAWGVRVFLTAGVVTVAALCAAAIWWLRPGPSPMYLARPSLDVRPAEELNAGGLYAPAVRTPGGSRTALAWSPDGQALVFVGRRGGVQQLFVRRLDGTEARPLTNTEGAQAPAVSADGGWVAFWAAGAIRKVPLGGGATMDLVSGLPIPPKGLTWSPDGRLYFGRDDGRIWMIPPAGAAAAITTVGEAEVAHTLPWPLPGGAILYTARKRHYSWGDEEVVAQTLSTGQRKVLLRDGADARYVASGYLVFLRRGSLLAVPFDAERLEIRGPEVPVLDTVAQSLSSGNNHDVTGAGQFSLAATGALAWIPGRAVPYADLMLVAIDRNGRLTQLQAPVRSYGPALRVSPDGRQVAVVVYSLNERSLWVYELDRGTLTPLAVGGEVFGPEWSPDGRRIAFGWLKDGRRSLAVQPADGTAPPQVLVAGQFFPSSFTPDGRQIAVSRDGDDILIGTDEKGQVRVRPLVETPQNEGPAEISPDGRWLAYASDVSGRYEVYVRPYSGEGAVLPVSVDGGGSVAWSHSGRELFFVSTPDAAGRQRMMAVDFAPGAHQPPDSVRGGVNALAGPRIGRPHALFEFGSRDLNVDCIPGRCYDVAPDGLGFYATRRTDPPAPAVVTHVNLIPDWVAELKAKVPRR